MSKLEELKKKLMTLVFHQRLEEENHERESLLLTFKCFKKSQMRKLWTIIRLFIKVKLFFLTPSLTHIHDPDLVPLELCAT